MNRCLLDVAPPYSLSLTVQVLRRVPTNIVDQWADGTYNRALRIGAKEYVLRVRQLDPVTLEVVASRPCEAALPLLRRMLGLDVDKKEAERARLRAGQSNREYHPRLAMPKPICGPAFCRSKRLHRNKKSGTSGNISKL